MEGEGEGESTVIPNLGMGVEGVREEGGERTTEENEETKKQTNKQGRGQMNQGCTN